MTERLSRSEQKRQFKQVEAAAKELSELSDLDLKRLPASDELKEEIILSRKTKAGARKRQIKYIAKILHHEPLEEILRFLQQKKGSKLEEDRFLHGIERLRDKIVDEALEAYDECRKYQEQWELDWQSKTIDTVVKRFQYVDEHEIRRSAHQYARNRSRTHYRELFRIIKSAAERGRLDEK